MQHYREHPLNIDIDRLGKCYFDVKSKLGLKTDDKTLIDFNAICVNRIPDDENSITGDIFVKPNDIMNANGVPSGDYLLQFDFMRNVFTAGTFSTSAGSRFYISEISPSRKEVRLYGRSGVNTNLLFNEEFRNNFNSKLGF